MGVKYLKDGQDFEFPASFGFGGSVNAPMMPQQQGGNGTMVSNMQQRAQMPMQQPVIAPRPMAKGGPVNTGMGPKPDNMGTPPAGMKKGGNFIAKAISKPGALHADLGVPQGQKIPAGKLAAAASKPGKVGQRARFAETLASMNHKKGK